MVIGAEARPVVVLENGCRLDSGTDCRPSIVTDGIILSRFVTVSSFLPSSKGVPKGSSKRLKGSSNR